MEVKKNYNMSNIGQGVLFLPGNVDMYVLKMSSKFTSRKFLEKYQRPKAN